MTKSLIIALLALAAAGPALAQPASPVVLEVFQSQGCSSCPPTNANVNALVDRPDLLALSFGVTYWDQLGWKDTFADKAYTARQWDYAHGLHKANVYTPQVVLNGKTDLVGGDRRALEAAIAAAGRPAGAVVTLTETGAAVAKGQGRGDVWLVRYDPRVRQVAIRAGENNGKTLPHRNIVVQLVKLGVWTGAAQTYAVPAAADAALKTAVLVQAPGGGPILGAARL